jgi:putative addiction module component (TIGR02574 family)
VDARARRDLGRDDPRGAIRRLHVLGAFAYDVRLQIARYSSSVVIEAVIHQVLQLPADERIELVERLIDSLDDDEVELSAEELAQLDEALSDGDRAVERGELIPVDAVLAQMRQIS